jgi:hypothetical protein
MCDMSSIKKLSLLFCTTLIFGFVYSCSNLAGVIGTFEQRYPISHCGDKVKVSDPNPLKVFGEVVDPLKGIWLLTPYIEIEGPLQAHLPNDLEYMSNMNDFLVDRIETSFVQKEWVADVKASGVNRLSAKMRHDMLKKMSKGALKLDSINYEGWIAPDELIRPDVPGYSLFMFIDGMFGNPSGVNQNTLYLFLIDNAERRVTYSDLLHYQCDVRDTEGLDKTLEYAFKKLLEVRFPPGNEVD